MKVSISKKMFVKALEHVLSSTYKTEKEEDSTILIDCDEYQLSIIGGNEENRLEFYFDAEVEEPGSAIISAKGLDKSLKGFKTNNLEITANLEDVFFRTDKDSSYASVINLKTCESDKFTIPENVKEVSVATIKASTIADALEIPILGVNKKTINESMRNLGVIINGNEMSFVGVSENQFSKNTFEIPNTGLALRLNTPLQAMKNIVKMFKKGQNDIKIALEENSEGTFLTFKNEFSSYAVIASNGFAEFEKMEEKISSMNDHEHFLKFNTADMYRIFSVIPGSAKVDSILSLSSSLVGDKLKISLENGANTSGTVIPCECKNIKKIFIQGKTLKELLSHMTEEQVKMEIINNQLAIINEGNIKNIISLIYKTEE